MRQDGQVYVQAHPRQPAHPQRQRAPFVVEPAELAFDRAALVVEALLPVGAARDQGVQPAGLEPDGAGLALAGTSAVLGRAALGVRIGERPLAMLALRRGGESVLDEGGHPHRNHRAHAPALHRLGVVTPVQHEHRARRISGRLA